MEKLNNLYDEFIIDLRKDIEQGEDIKFNQALIEYLKAMRYVATIDADNIDKDKINTEIGVIVDFVGDTDNYIYNRELREVIGFKTVECDKLSEGDYYYYLADQQAKALVFYTRYLNFLNHCEKPVLSESLLDILESFGEVISETGVDVGDIELCESAIKCLNDLYKNPLEQPDIHPAEIEYYLKLFKDYKNKIELLKHPEKHIEHKKYFMFNNVLKELKFNGASHEFLWNWNVSEKTLFRSGPLDTKGITDYKVEFEYGMKYHQAVGTSYNDEEVFVKMMIADALLHMNGYKKDNFRSFSEVGLISIYKYLTFPTSEPEDNETTQFNIIKEAKLNSIFNDNDNEPKSFQSFLNVTGKNINDIKTYELNKNFYGNGENKIEETFADCLKLNKELYKNHSFTVEVYPEPKAGVKTNVKGTELGLKFEKLPKYVQSLGLDIELDLNEVGDDKEVITYGKCYDKKISFNKDTFNKDTFDEADPGTLFSLDLTKEDIIYLLLKIYDKKTELIKKDLGFIKEEYFDIDDKNQITYIYISNYNNDNETLVFEYGENKNDVTNKEDFDKEKYLKDFVIAKNNEYNKILTQKHPQSDFILSVLDLSTETFKLLSYYYQYKTGGKLDTEITILKEIIFKS